MFLNKHYSRFFLFTTFFFINIVLEAEILSEKILICGIAKNVGLKGQIAIDSIEELGNYFSDYKVIIYENNSTDITKLLFSRWREINDHVQFLSEDLSDTEIAKETEMNLCSRLEVIARARNIVLKEAMKSHYNEYKYILMADLDLGFVWDIQSILATIISPELEWDAVFANGNYDLLAFRDQNFPIGHELLGIDFFSYLKEQREKMNQVAYFRKDQPWIPVYSAFGGIGIYKREALKGCRYSGVVTKELEEVVQGWLIKAELDNAFFLDKYKCMVRTLPILDVKDSRSLKRLKLSQRVVGMRLFNHLGTGKVVWFSCEKGLTLPSVCEHIVLHAQMYKNGRTRLFMNPKWESQHR